MVLAKLVYQFVMQCPPMKFEMVKIQCVAIEMLSVCCIWHVLFTHRVAFLWKFHKIFSVCLSWKLRRKTRCIIIQSLCKSTNMESAFSVYVFLSIVYSWEHFDRHKVSRFVKKDENSKGFAMNSFSIKNVR